MPVTLPPLRERREDIPLLCEHFLQRFRAAHGKAGLRLDAGALEALRAHAWPGNIRELQNVLERLVILSGGALTLDRKSTPLNSSH